MAKSNTSGKSDPYPRELNTAKMRREIDPDNGAAAQHERDMARIQRMHDKLNEK